MPRARCEPPLLSDEPDGLMSDWRSAGNSELEQLAAKLNLGSPLLGAHLPTAGAQLPGFSGGRLAGGGQPPAGAGFGGARQHGGGGGAFAGWQGMPQGLMPGDGGPLPQQLPPAQPGMRGAPHFPQAQHVHGGMGMPPLPPSGGGGRFGGLDFLMGSGLSVAAPEFNANAPVFDPRAAGSRSTAGMGGPPSGMLGGAPSGMLGGLPSGMLGGEGLLGGGGVAMVPTLDEDGRPTTAPLALTPGMHLTPTQAERFVAGAALSGLRKTGQSGRLDAFFSPHTLRQEAAQRCAPHRFFLICATAIPLSPHPPLLQPLPLVFNPISRLS
eukprot:scaffold12707_cov142-Isochrysis_galbana.AAC.3